MAKMKKKYNKKLERANPKDNGFLYSVELGRSSCGHPHQDGVVVG